MGSTAWNWVNCQIQSPRRDRRWSGSMARVSACGTLGSSAAASQGSLCRSSQARKSPASSSGRRGGRCPAGVRVYAVLIPAGGGFAELALASAEQLAPMPASASFQEAAGLVISAGTAYEALLDRGRLQAGETVLITAAAGGVGSAAVQIAVAHGARALGVASPANHEYLRGLGASEVFDYHAADWVQQVRARVPGGVDLLLDAAGGQTRDQAIGAVRDGGRAFFIVLQSSPPQLERGITGESFAAHVDRERLEALSRLVDAGKLRPQVEAVLPLDHAREALERVASRHTRGKIALEIGE